MAKEIPLTRGLTAIVDDEDYERLSRHKWAALSGGGAHYAVRSGRQADGERGRVIFMHHAVIGARINVDHKNRNPPDNRRANLRACTHAQNCANRARKNKTGYRGVSARKSGKFNAQINCRHIGNFDTAIEAARAFDAAAKTQYGEFAVLNGV